MPVRCATSSGEIASAHSAPAGALFVTASVANERVEPIVRSLLPFLAAEIVIIFLVTFFPALTLTIPRWLGFMQ